MEAFRVTYSRLKQGVKPEILSRRGMGFLTLGAVVSGEGLLWKQTMPKRHDF